MRRVVQRDQHEVFEVHHAIRQRTAVRAVVRRGADIDVLEPGERRPGGAIVRAEERDVGVVHDVIALAHRESVAEVSQVIVERAAGHRRDR